MTSADIKRHARSLGFDLCGVARAESYPELEALPVWLARGFGGRMTYLDRTARRRSDVRQWLPSARSVIAVGMVYHSDAPLSVERADPREAVVARYAWGTDYHRQITTRLVALLAWMRGVAGVTFDARLGVDDAPVQERVYAMRAGLGWIGKHTCLVHPERGSFFVLGELVVSLDLTPDDPLLDQCGTCQLCLDACPTSAIVAPYVVDATRCLSYLTIEIRKAIPEAQREGLGSRVFGCDVCQDVCPFNAQAPTAREACWQPRVGLVGQSLADLWRASDDRLAERIAPTALTRRGVAGLRRNLAVSMGNSGDTRARDVLREARDNAPTTDDPVVREHVDWAINRLR